MLQQDTINMDVRNLLVPAYYYEDISKNAHAWKMVSLLFWNRNSRAVPYYTKWLCLKHWIWSLHSS